MKKQDIIILSRLGVPAIPNHDLSVAHAYKVVKFRKALQGALETIGKDEDALQKDAGIEAPETFDKELDDLRKNKHRTQEEQARLDEMEAKLKRFIDLREEMLKEEVTLDCKSLPYEEWFKLQRENRDKEVGGVKRDILSGWVEDTLQGVLWNEPEE